MDSDNFFISKEGKTDLKKELFETIDALKNGKSDVRRNGCGRNKSS